MEVKTYEDIAERDGLDETTKKRYCYFMRARYGKNKEAHYISLSYATEWAKRFKLKQEYMRADPVGQAVLAGIETAWAKIEKLEKGKATKKK